MTLLPLFTSHTVKALGVDIHAVEGGDNSRPTILFLHGYPDDHQVWSYQMQALVKDYHVVSFDLRGMGKSTAPHSYEAYRIADILEDITCVIKSVVGVKKKVHLVGHDWGSIIGWHFVTHPDYSKQYVLSYSTLSGPHLGMASVHLINEMMSFTPLRMLNAAKQVAKSWYIGFFHIPAIPEKLYEATGLGIWKQLLRRNGIRSLDAYIEMANKEEVERLLINGLNLYRCNITKQYASPQRQSIRQPVQLFIAKNDTFLAPSTFDNVDYYAQNVSRIELDAGHWAMREDPDTITRAIKTFIDDLEPQ